jgi:hypothetical protein
LDALSICHENVIFRPLGQGDLFLVPPYADSITSFWKGRLAAGPRAPELPPVKLRWRERFAVMAGKFC